VPLKTYHIGADETAGAWSKSPACNALMKKTGRKIDQLGPMFIERVAASLARRGIEVAGWSDGLGHVNAAKMPKKVQSNIWSDLFTTAPAEAHAHANRGWRTVISVPNLLYFDMPYAPHPLERGYDWGTRGADTFKLFSFLPENIPANASVMKDIKNKPAKTKDTEPLSAGRALAGSQAQLWSETVRSDATADYMLFPRLLAFAERAWHRAAWEPTYRRGESYTFGDGKVDPQATRSDWAGFAAKLPEHLRHFDEVGIFYRLAPPGARITNGTLEANTELPGQAIEYRVSGGSWQPYQGPVRVSRAVQLRTRSFDGRRASRIVEVPSP
jgi:hexosaminidase